MIVLKIDKKHQFLVQQFVISVYYFFANKESFGTKKFKLFVFWGRAGTTYVMMLISHFHVATTIFGSKQRVVFNDFRCSKNDNHGVANLKPQMILFSKKTKQKVYMRVLD